MSARHPARAVAALLLAGLADCGDARYECTPVEVCAARGARDTGESLKTFERECVGAGCGVEAPRGGVGFGESFHPAYRALLVRAGAVAAVPMEVRGEGDGVTIAANVRCDEGATLRVSDDVSRAPGPVVLSGPSHWRRVERVMYHPSATDPALYPDARRAVVQLEVTGQGACAIDRLRYIRTAIVCVLTVTKERCAWVSPRGADSGAGPDAPDDL